MVYKCPDCDKEFQRKLHLENHLNKNKKCVKLTEEAKNSELYCKDCDKLFARKDNLQIHKTKCKGIKKNISTTASSPDITTEIQNNEHCTININNHVDNHVDNSIHNIDNSINTYNININFVINDVGKENTDYITDKMLLELINLYKTNKEKFIIELIKLIHCNEEHKDNMNMHLFSTSNLSNMYTKENEKWTVKKTQKYLREYTIQLLLNVKKKLAENEELEIFAKEKIIIHKLFELLVYGSDKSFKNIIRQIIWLLIENHAVIIENKKKYMKEQKELKNINEILKQKELKKQQTTV